MALHGSMFNITRMALPRARVVQSTKSTSIRTLTQWRTPARIPTGCAGITTNTTYQPTTHNRSMADSADSATTTNLMYTRQPFWQRVERWNQVSEQDFLSHRWQVRYPRRSSCMQFRH